MQFAAIKTGIKKYFTPVYIVIVLAFMVWFFYKTRGSLVTYLQNFNALYLIGSAILLAGFYLFQCLAFKHIQSHNARIRPDQVRLTDWLYAFFYGLMGHYIPGKISVVLGRIMVLQPFGISKEATILCVLYETVISVTVSFAIGLPLIFIADIAVFHQLYVQVSLAILFFAAVIIFIFTPLFQKSVFILLRLFKFSLSSKDIFLNRQTLMRAVTDYVISYLFMMLAFYLFCRSITALSFDLRTVYIVGASMVFSGAVGLIALFTPSGLGVREAGIVYFISVATGLIPLELALLIAVCFRILTAIVEIITFALSAWLYNRSAPHNTTE